MKNISDLQTGKAGEYLVCADIILQGHVAFLSEQGLPFDVVLDYENRLYKVQVKTTKDPRLNGSDGKVPSYIFGIGKNGKNGSRTQYIRGSVDLFALVALDTKQVAYFPYNKVLQTMSFRVSRYRGEYRNERATKLKGMVIELKNKGYNCSDIAKELDLTLSNVYKYSADVSIEQKGTRKPIYFEDLNLEKCMEELRFNQHTAQQILL